MISADLVRLILRWRELMEETRGVGYAIAQEVQLDDVPDKIEIAGVVVTVLREAGEGGEPTVSISLEGDDSDDGQIVHP